MGLIGMHPSSRGGASPHRAERLAPANSVTQTHQNFLTHRRICKYKSNNNFSGIHFARCAHAAPASGVNATHRKIRVGCVRDRKGHPWIQRPKSTRRHLRHPISLQQLRLMPISKPRARTARLTRGAL
jgi:hypothetical protein